MPMDERARFWLAGYKRIVELRSGKGENEVNIYTEHGWRTRIKVFRRLFGRMLENGILRPGMRCADFGCGTAKYSRIMREAGMCVFPADICLDILKYAHRRDRRLRCVNADSTCLPFKASSFDFVISFGMISIMSETNGFFKELQRVAGNASVIMVMTLNRIYFENLIVWFLKKFGFRKNAPRLPENVEIIQYAPRKLLANLREYFPRARFRLKLVPIFIFSKRLRFLEDFFQGMKIFHFALFFFASAFIVTAKRR